MLRSNRRTLQIPVVALAVALTAVIGTGAVSAQKGKGGPGYTLQVLGLPAGFASALAVGINDLHEIVGTARVGVSGGSSRAVYWAHAGAAPVLLPCPSEPCESSATAINASGVIAGTANSEAVLWHPSESGWILEVLLNPGPLDDTSVAVADAVLDNGTAAGFYMPTRATWTPNDVPVIWGVLGSVAQLPLPAGMLGGRLGRINDSDDAVGTVRTNDGTDPTYVYGALWINEGGAYVTERLSFFVNDITPRSADGSFLVASDVGRLRVWNAAGSWNYVVESNPGGPGTAINAAGDMVGVLPKKGEFSLGGTPYVLTIGGTFIKLPFPSGSSAMAAAVSSDRWVAGWLYLKTERPAAVWRPTN